MESANNVSTTNTSAPSGLERAASEGQARAGFRATLASMSYGEALAALTMSGALAGLSEADPDPEAVGADDSLDGLNVEAVEAGDSAPAGAPSAAAEIQPGLESAHAFSSDSEGVAALSAMVEPQSKKAEQAAEAQGAEEERAEALWREQMEAIDAKGDETVDKLPEAAPILAEIDTYARRAGLPAAPKIHVHSARAEKEGAEGLATGGAIHLAGGVDELQSEPGRLLLAHELVHVAQQRPGSQTPNSTLPKNNRAEAESEADKLAEQVVKGGRAQVQVQADPRATYHKKASTTPAKKKSSSTNTSSASTSAVASQVAVMKQGGIVYREIVIQEAKRAGVPLALACAVLEKETSGGHNVFGNDYVKPGQVKGGKVTKKKYEEYKKLRKQGYGMQGVGPMQLTWYTLQDKADALGGCWVPRWNIRVGLEHLKSLIQTHGLWAGVKAYNGTGQAATNYANSVIQKMNKWKAALAKGAPTGQQPAPQAPSGGGALTSAQVQSALAYNRGRGHKGRWIRRICEAVGVSRKAQWNSQIVQGVAKFQKARGLAVDGKVGPATWAAVKSRLATHHGWGNGSLLTNAEAAHAVQYNKSRNLSDSFIKKIQTRVGVAADGAIGPVTCRAIAKFQKSRGLPTYGTLTPKTLNALKKKGNTNAPSQGPGATPKPGKGNFSLSEFASKDGSPTPAWVKTNIYSLIAQLEVLRSALGNRAISITSGYRSPSHNKKVGGAPNSLHLSGKAADIQVSGKSPSTVANTIESLIKSGKMKQGGIGVYSSWVHYDTRGSYARW